MEFVVFITLIILFFCCVKVYENFSSDVVYVKSKIDNRKYLVQNLKDKEKAADMLAKLRKKLIKFTNHIYKEHPTEEIKRLKMKYKPNNITESGSDGNYTSYNVNKGQKIVFCIRERDKYNNLVKMNTIFFVALHELAHIMTKSIGHNKEFWDNFKFLLKFAIDNGYYKYTPYHIKPEKYCGIIITDTPYKK